VRSTATTSPVICVNPLRHWTVAVSPGRRASTRPGASFLITSSALSRDVVAATARRLPDQGVAVVQPVGVGAGGVEGGAVDRVGGDEVGQHRPRDLLGPLTERDGLADTMRGALDEGGRVREVL